MLSTIPISEKMIPEAMVQMPKELVLSLIREKLSFPREIAKQLKNIGKEDFKSEHRRFEMSGYEDHPGEVTLFNNAILNEFAFLGIYDYTYYLFLDFYKGDGTLYLRYFNTEENVVVNLSGYSTSKIIYEIFELTIFSNLRKRRRE